MFSWFRNMKLGMKIGGGFALILLIGIFMAYMGYSGLSTVDQKTQAANGTSHISEGSLELRAIEKDYKITMDSSYKEEFNSKVSELNKTIEDTKAILRHQDDKDQMDKLKKDLKSYQDAFITYLDENVKQQKLRSDYVNYEETISADIYKLLDMQQSEVDNLLSELANINTQASITTNNDGIVTQQSSGGVSVQQGTQGVNTQQGRQALNTDNNVQKEDLDKLTLKMESLVYANNLVDKLNMMSIQERNFVINLSNDELQGKYIEATSALFPEAISIATTLKDKYLMQESDKQFVGGIITQLKNMQQTFKEIAQTEYNKDEQKPIMDANADEFVSVASKIQNDSINEADVAQKSAVTALLTAIIAALIVGILLAVVITRSLTKPIGRAVKIGNSIAENDLTEDVPEEFINRKDEIGDLAKAFDLMIKNLNEIITRISLSAENVSGSAEEISAGNQDLSQRTEEQASSLEEFSATIEEITSSMDASSANATEADTLSNQTMKSVKDGQDVVQNMIGAMEDITQSSNEIAEIISTVNDIAFQTNLLALNAAVEAARAGESGRGFAVVAAEVRNLAGRSAESAEEIEKLINKSINRINNGNDLMEETSNVLETIVTNTQKTNDVVSEIAASLSEQSKAADEIRNTIEQLNQVTQQNSSLVEEIASSSENMSAEAVEMANQVDRFKLADNRARNQMGNQRKNHRNNYSANNNQFNNQLRQNKPSSNETTDVSDDFDNFSADDFEKF